MPSFTVRRFTSYDNSTKLIAVNMSSDSVQLNNEVLSVLLSGSSPFG